MQVATEFPTAEHPPPKPGASSWGKNEDSVLSPTVTIVPDRIPTATSDFFSTRSLITSPPYFTRMVKMDRATGAWPRAGENVRMRASATNHRMDLAHRIMRPQNRFNGFLRP